MKQRGTEDKLRRGEVSVTALKESDLFVKYLKERNRKERELKFIHSFIQSFIDIP
jgi:hypothetical protein